jgi:antitoxin CptB
MEKSPMDPNLKLETRARLDASPSAHPGSRIDPRRLARLRWRCRRGKLENDLILERFLDARGDAISEQELGGLDRVLALGDDELWDLLSGRREPEDAALAPLVAALRAV